MIAKREFNNLKLMRKRRYRLSSAVFMTLSVAMIFIGSVRADDTSERRGENHFKRWEELTPQDRAMYKERLRKWRQLDQLKQREMLENFREYKNTSPEERHNIKENWQRWQQFGPDKKKVLRNKYMEMRRHERGAPDLEERGKYDVQDRQGEGEERKGPGFRRDNPPGPRDGNGAGPMIHKPEHNRLNGNIRPMRRPGGGGGHGR